MSELLSWTPLLLIICIVLLIVLLVRQSQSLRREAESRHLQETELTRLGNQLLDELDAQRDDIHRSLDNANRSMISNISELSRTQTALLESMQRQILLSTRNQEERLDALRQENEHQLTEMRHTVDEKLSDSLDRKLNDSFAQVSERLEAVYRGLGEMHTLASGVGDLKKVLTNVKTRGIWGRCSWATLSVRS